MPKQRTVDYGAALQKAFDRWDDIHKNGCDDPFWPDGVNLELVRNHILYYRALLEETPTLFGFPEIYYREVPPEIPQSYMARPDEIRAAAKASLEVYRADPDYQFIAEHREEIPEKVQKKLCIGAALGYVSGLERAIAEDNLVAMRRHEDPDSYLPGFVSCARQIRECLYDGEDFAGIQGNEDPEDEDFEEEPEEEIGGMTMTM